MSSENFRNQLARLGADTYARLEATHWHVAYGLPGYGPDCDESTPAFGSLGDALEYAREELSTDIDMAHDAAHAFGDSGQFEDAWREVLRCEELETLRANLDPERRSAPLYADDPEGYARLQESQASDFPHDVAEYRRLYLWDCSEPECAPSEECPALIDLSAPIGREDDEGTVFLYACPSCGAGRRVRASAFRGGTAEPAIGAIVCGAELERGQ